LARIISDTDQVKTAVTAALASFLRNISLIVVYLAILVGLSWRLTLVALVLAPVLALIIRPIVARVRRRSREQADDRGELTSLVSEMVASVRLVRAYVAEAFEVERFQQLADRYRKRVLRAQGASTLTWRCSVVRSWPLWGRRGRGRPPSWTCCRASTSRRAARSSWTAYRSPALPGAACAR